MRIVYPYNEILPHRKAHDVFVFSENAQLAASGIDVHLLCGKGSQNIEALCHHYDVAKSQNFHLQPLPILRKNNFLKVSWNFPFFFSCQKALKKLKPDWVILSVRKQANYHLARKIPGVKYLYEVHELSFYPNQNGISSDVAFEKNMLQKADVITVTTQALKDILLSDPYSLKVPIEVVPLGVRTFSCQPISYQMPLILTYVGQLYAGQGIEILLKAMQRVENVLLRVVGGTQTDIERLKSLAQELDIDKKVHFLGFKPPSSLEDLLAESHAFVAPFQNSGRMPYVAHTKLFEYAHTGKPFIAPHLPIVQEHFTDKRGVLFYEPDDSSSLAQKIQALCNKEFYEAQQKEIASLEEAFTWEKRILRYKEILEKNRNQC